MKRFFLIWLGGLLLLGALLYRLQPSAERRGFVAQIRVYSQQGNQIRSMQITDSQKMEEVLNLLRAFDTRLPAQRIPAADADNSHTIRILLADGTSHIYRLRSDRFLCKDSLSWKVLKPTQGRRLSQLLSSNQNRGFAAVFCGRKETFYTLF